jgi:hypothetical protein
MIAQQLGRTASGIAVQRSRMKRREQEKASPESSLTDAIRLVNSFLEGKNVEAEIIDGKLVVYRLKMVREAL